MTSATITRTDVEVSRKWAETNPALLVKTLSRFLDENDGKPISIVDVRPGFFTLRAGV